MKIKTKMRRKKLISFLAILLCLVILFLLASNTQIKVISYEIISEKVDKELVMAVITDYHSCSYGEGQCTLLNEVYQQKPDVVLLGGDIFDDKLPHENAIELLSALSEKYPCFYVSGNHEFRSGDIDNIKSTVRNLGIYILEGEGGSFEFHGQKLTICGIDDPDVGESVFQQQLISCGRSTDENFFSVLLSHRPERIQEFGAFDFDLIVSGHTHGGQWRIPGLLNGLLAPNQGFFPRYAGGLYSFDDMNMVVSRGLAKESTRVPRIFNRPELVIIHVIPREKGVNLLTTK